MNSGDRYKLTVTDGVTTTIAICASQVAHMMADRTVKEFTVLCIEEYMISDMGSSR